jgi:6-pyruvoyltetrahydropterin/6-carboxytetrahydropterin synthase
MGIVYLTRIEHFNAAHRLYNPSWTDEKNEEIYGKCANANWHGHNFELFVTVKGIPSLETGFVMDAKKLSKIVNESIIDIVDHRNLNIDVPFMEGKTTSIENLVINIWEILEPLIPSPAQLHCVKLVETSRIYIEYFG